MSRAPAISLTNRSRARRVLEDHQLREVVLAPPAPDLLHPAFSNLFVQTEILRPRQAILAPGGRVRLGMRCPGSVISWRFTASRCGRLLRDHRLAFVGRGNSLAAPEAMRVPVRSGAGRDRCSIRSSRSGPGSRWSRATVTINVVTGSPTPVSVPGAG